MSPHKHTKVSSEMTFSEKSIKRLSHWIHHNEDHAHNYREWASQFDQHQLPGVKALLESAAELTEQINKILEEARQLIPIDALRHKPDAK